MEEKYWEVSTWTQQQVTDDDLLQEEQFQQGGDGKGKT